MGKVCVCEIIIWSPGFGCAERWGHRTKLRFLQLSLSLSSSYAPGTGERAGSSGRTSLSTEHHGEESGHSQPQGNQAGSSQAGRDHRSLGQAEGTL